MNDVNKEYALIDEEDVVPNNTISKVIDITAHQLEASLKAIPKDSEKYKKNIEIVDVLKKTVQELDTLNRKVALLEGKARKENKVLLELNAKGGGLVPPQAIELEQAILGACMLENSAFFKIQDILTVDCFYKQAHGEIFNAIKTLFFEESPIDLLTVIQKLRKLGKIEAIGGPQYIAELTSKVSSAANIVYHSKVLQEKALARSMITLFREKTAALFNESNDVIEVLDNATEDILNLRAEYLNEEWEWQK